MTESVHPLLSTDNQTKRKLLAGDVALGVFLLSNSSIIAEACSTLPLDWLIADMEASPISKADLMHIFQALSGSNLAPMVRVDCHNRHTIEHALDLGALGILVPKVDTAASALEIVDACRFPPDGHRGINPVRASGYFSNVDQYLRIANQRTLVMVQIESVEAIANIDQIAAVPGIDVIFIGCGDLASSLGQPGVVTGEKMDDARARILSETLKAKKIPGIFAYGIDLARQYAEEGFLFIAIGNDIKALRESISSNLDRFYTRV